jgi:uncharacterized protein (DUF433 family)
MGHAVKTTQVPIFSDEDGVLRVSGSRITLDIIIQAFNTGATSEEIVQQFPTLYLSDV